MYGGGAPKGEVVSVTPADPNLARGSLVTLNASDGTGTRPGGTTTSPRVDNDDNDNSGSESPEPSGIDTEELERQLNEMAEGLQQYFR